MSWGGSGSGSKNGDTLSVSLLLMYIGTKSAVQSHNQHIQEGISCIVFLHCKLYLAVDAVQVLQESVDSGFWVGPN